MGKEEREHCGKEGLGIKESFFIVPTNATAADSSLQRKAGNSTVCLGCKVGEVIQGKEVSNPRAVSQERRQQKTWEVRTWWVRRERKAQKIQKNL